MKITLDTNDFFTIQYFDNAFGGNAEDWGSGSFVDSNGELQHMEQVEEFRNPASIAEGISIRINLSKLRKAMATAGVWWCKDEELAKANELFFNRAGSSDLTGGPSLPPTVTTQGDFNEYLASTEV
jgi:hypothetical protein